MKDGNRDKAAATHLAHESGAVDSHVDTSSAQVTRRSFLASAGALAGAAAHPMAFGNWSASSGLSFRRLAEPRLTETQQSLVVSLDGQEWTLRPGLFGSRAELTHTVSHSDQGHLLRLENAHFPGSDLRADFTAALYSSRNAWVIRLNFIEAGIEVELDLVAWMSGDAGARYSAPLRGDRSYITVGSGATALAPREGAGWIEFDALLTARLSSEQGFVYANGRFDISMSAANISAVPALVADHAHAGLPPNAEAAFSDIRFDRAVCVEREIKLVRVDRRLRASLLPGNSAQVTLVGYGQGSRRDASIVLHDDSGTGALLVRGGATGPQGTRLQLQRWRITAKANGVLEKLILRAALRSEPGRPFGIATDALAVTIAGLPGESFEVAMENGSVPSLGLYASVRSAHLSIPTVSAAELTFDTAPIVWLSFGKPLPDPKRRLAFANLHIGRDASRFTAPLDFAHLLVRRSADKFNLRFRLPYFSLSSGSAPATITQQALPAASHPTLPDQHCLVVSFPPQHEFEEAFEDEGTCAPAQKKSRGLLAKKTTGSSRPARRRLGDRNPDLARTLLAEESRLVFALPATKVGQPVPLTVEWLTDWAQRDLVVNKRAMPRNASLSDQLKRAGITTGMSRNEAKEQITKSILGDNFGSPGQFQTAIEPVYQLIVSPDSKARFSVPVPLTWQRYPVLWNTELINHADVGMRALWARGMQLDSGLFSGDDAPLLRRHPFAGALHADQAEQIVGMTSFYGLPALRRLKDSSVAPPSLSRFARAVANACAPNQGKKWDDDPNGMVFLPNEDYRYLDNARECNVVQEGVMLARAFDRFRLKLGHTADLDALWKGEPPSPYESKRHGRFFTPVFGIERYTHRTVQGRDVFVEVLEKGFLFPVGHRVAFLQVTYRDYKGYLNDPFGDPTAYLVQELYIVANKPDKTFRAYDQPYQSRDFPCELVSMATQKTPKLADPEDIDLGPDAIGRAFWPTQSCAANAPVLFSYRIDGQAEEARSKLIFVSNQAAHDPKTMRALVDYYNHQVPVDDRTVSHAGASRRYAPENKPGECSFNTAAWLLVARGRLMADGAEHFDMDAFMEGEDQPPFYPVVAQAKLNVASVERLTGRPGLYIEAAFNRQFVVHGFDGKVNPSEIFLDVLTEGVQLNGNDAHGATGGVASMDAQLAGLSRKTGPVGGKPIKVKSASSPIVLQTPGKRAQAAPVLKPAEPGGSVERTQDMSSALAGTFSPFEFLGDAKVLGVLYLRDLCQAAVISAAPKLIEQAEYAAQGVEQTVDALRVEVRNAVRAVGKLARDTLSDAESALRGQMQHSTLTLADLYGPLHAAITGLITACEAADAVLDKLPSLPQVQALVTELKNAVDRLLHELKALAKDPVPSIVGQALADLQAIWKMLRDPVGELAKTVEDIFIKRAFSEFVTVLSTPANQYLLAVILGPQGARRDDEPDAAYAQRMLSILKNPSAVLGDMQEALLYETFSRPMFEALQLLSNARAAAGAEIEWSRRRAVTVITGVMRRGAAALPAEELEGAARQMVEAIDKELSTPRPNLDQLADEIDDILRKAVDAGRQAVLARLAHLDPIYAKAKTDALRELDLHLAKEAREGTSDATQAAYRQLLVARRLADEQAASVVVLLDLVKSDSWKQIVDAIVADLQSEFRRAVQAAVDAQKAALREAADDLAGKVQLLATRTLDIVEKWSGVARLQAVGEQLERVCSGTAGQLTEALRVMGDTLLSVSDVIDARLVSLDHALHDAAGQLDQLGTPSAEAEAIQSQAAAALQGLIRNAGAVRALAAELQAARSTWRKALISKCAIHQVFDGATQITALRARVPLVIAEALRSVAGALGQQPQRALTLAAPYVEFKNALKCVRAELFGLAADLTGLAKIADSAPEWHALRTFVQGVAPESKPSFAAMERLAADWRKDPTDIVDRLLSEYRQLDRRIAGVLMQMVLPKKAFIDPMLTALTVMTRAFGEVLLPMHELAGKQLTGLQGLIGPGTVASSVLPVRIGQDLDAAARLLAEDIKELTEIKARGTLDTARALGARWQRDGSGMACLSRIAARIVELVSSGNVMQLFDVAALQRRLAEEVASFLPTKIKLNYDFDSELGNFPAVSPVFAMDRDSYGSAREMRYSEDAPYPKNDLVLTTRIEVDLLTQQRTIQADGRIRPFSLHLLGSLDFITLYFNGLHFRSKPGGSIAIDTAVTDVKIGALLEFLSLIQNFISSGDGNGVYRDLQFFPPALEVGYRYNEPMITIGTMQLLNVGFRVGALLPLDDRQAEFFAYLSSREAPLLIIVLPYAGGGFIGLRATARGIVSFEILLEFGFAGAMAFGPLRATARATAGFYLQQSAGARVFEGFVHAIGAGQVGCFGVGVNIEIKMRQEADGSMAGSSSFSYSFKVGFFKISFKVVASRKQGNRGGGGNQRTSGTMRAAGPGLLSSREAVCDPNLEPAVISNALRKEVEWTKYKRHLDLSEAA